ncbi:MAG: hypothetical protein MZV70_43905 [Desulfobacterales bacterium]|nr:hypothetical protein [Desulfobacterales bacterium]
MPSQSAAKRGGPGKICGRLSAAAPHPPGAPAETIERAFHGFAPKDRRSGQRRRQPAILKLVSDSLWDDIIRLDDPKGIYAYCLNCQTH